MEIFEARIHLIPLAFTALFPVINPIGASFILYGMSGDLTFSERRKMATGIAIYTFCLLAFFLFFGADILSLFGLHIPAIQVAGGLIIAAMGWKLLNDPEPDLPLNTDNKALGVIPKIPGTLRSKWFYPFTFPIIVGPGGMSVALTLSAHTKSLSNPTLDRLAVLIGILGVTVLLFFCLLYLKILSTKLSQSANLAISKVFAFLVVCIGVEITSEGVIALAKSI